MRPVLTKALLQALKFFLLLANDFKTILRNGPLGILSDRFNFILADRNLDIRIILSFLLRLKGFW